tara:strand:- start:2939 stop:3178 length:240 start_codon:yes stop_codon:yes gene_type:complete
MYRNVIKEAVIFGIMSTIMGSFVNLILFSADTLQMWSQNYVIEISLFFSGFFMHLFSEITGINRLFWIDLSKRYSESKE